MKLNLKCKLTFVSFASTFIALSYLSSCSPAAPKLVPKAIVTVEKVTNANNDVFRRPSVDILFVVDESRSMDVHQQNLSNNMNRFIDEFVKSKLIDYHIGVVSTSVNTTSPYTPASIDGKLYGKKAKFVDGNTPNGLAIIKENLKLGGLGDGKERLFDPIHLALAPKMTAVGGYNYGFYREDAYLVIILITDAEDQSLLHNATDTMNFLLSLKKNDKSKILSYGAVIPSTVAASLQCRRDPFESDPQGLSFDGPKPVKIESFLNLNINKGKNTVWLCDPSFGQKLADFSKEITLAVNKPIILSRPPILSSIVVTFGSQIIPANADIGWSFDAKLNAIVFGENLILDETQPKGTNIDVSFESAKFAEEL